VYQVDFDMKIITSILLQITCKGNSTDFKYDSLSHLTHSWGKNEIIQPESPIAFRIENLELNLRYSSTRICSTKLLPSLACVRYEFVSTNIEATQIRVETTRKLAFGTGPECQIVTQVGTDWKCLFELKVQVSGRVVIDISGDDSSGLFIHCQIILHCCLAKLTMKNRQSEQHPLQ
jgi:hypothetical protein